MAQTATLGNNRQAILAENTLSQSSLWRFGISGDLAILLLEIDRADRSGFAKELLRAFEYFKVHGLLLDLVIINDVKSSQNAGANEGNKDRDGLTHFIRNMANTEHLWASHPEAGHVYVLNGDEISDAERTLLRTVARLGFNTRDGLTIEQQLHNLEAANQHYQDKMEYPALRCGGRFCVWSSLEFYNQYGGFDNEGRDYVVTNTNTPMPWVNVIANPRFGCVVSSTMAGFTFAHNAQQFKLTGWSNDMVRDNASEMLLINRRQFVPATARHSQGYSAFDADYEQMEVKVRTFVALERMERYYQIRVSNKTSEPLDLQLDMVYKLVLGVCEEQTARYLYSVWDETSGSILTRNVYHPIYSDQVVQLSVITDGSTAGRLDYSLDYPNRKRLGMRLTVAGEGECEVAFIIAVHSRAEAPARGFTIEGINDEFRRVRNHWDERLGTIQVETPDRALNHMLNHWYLYQVYAARLFARAGFYQVGGATGFRDQLQDVMSILYSDPDYARRQILDHAAHQFAEGDVLHWWHESMHLGTRTTFSDDYLWLVFVTYQYLRVTGDEGILTERVAFCQSDQLGPGEAERCINYALPDGPDNANFEYATLYEHLRRAMNRAMHRIGIHGLPLMGCGDWNDGMSHVGVEGKGESVWVALFLADAAHSGCGPGLLRGAEPFPHAAGPVHTGQCVGWRLVSARILRQRRPDGEPQQHGMPDRPHHPGVEHPDRRGHSGTEGDHHARDGQPPGEPRARDHPAAHTALPTLATLAGLHHELPRGCTRKRRPVYAWCHVVHHGPAEGGTLRHGLLPLLAHQPHPPHADPCRCAQIQGRAVLHCSGHLQQPAASGPRRLDVVHRLGLLGLQDGHRKYPRFPQAGQPAHARTARAHGVAGVHHPLPLRQRAVHHPLPTHWNTQCHAQCRQPCGRRADARGGHPLTQLYIQKHRALPYMAQPDAFFCDTSSVKTGSTQFLS